MYTVLCLLTGMLLIHGMPPYSVSPKRTIALLYSYACLALPFSQIIREYIVGAWCLRVFWARRQAGLQEVLEALLGAEPRLKICSECSLERDVQQFSVTSFCKGSERNCDFFSLWRMICAQKPAYILTFKFSPYRKQGRSASLFIMNQVISHCFFPFWQGYAETGLVVLQVQSAFVLIWVGPNLTLVYTL